jgi:SAM-dependent methyltransferase
MTLPDVEACLSLGPAGWGALGRRLRTVGLTWQVYEPFQRLASNAHRALRSPIAKWHLRRDTSPGAIALRMFAFWDPVTPAEACAALGEDMSLERLLEAGVLVRAEAGVVSPFVLRFVDDLYVLADDVNSGGDAVMGVGPTTTGLVAAARPPHRAHRALDLGCGAGTVALSLAASCDQVVATDISPRAVTLARINAWLNGITNVECRMGDLFAPVAAESFDLVVCQPPFVARDDGAPATTFLFGGARGDELVMTLLGEVARHLVPGGIAVLLVEWPIVDGDPPIEQRVRAALGAAEDTSLLVLRWADTDVDDHCARYPMIGHPWQDSAFERDAIRRREHFERARIRALRPTFTVVRRNRTGGGWTSAVDGVWPGHGKGVAGQLDRLMRTRDLVAEGPAALLSAKLVIPAGVNFARATEEGQVEVRLEPYLMQESLTFNEAAATLARAVAGAPSVDEGIARYAAAAGEARASFADDALAAVKEALLHGVLEVSPARCL